MSNINWNERPDTHYAFNTFCGPNEAVIISDVYMALACGYELVTMVAIRDMLMITYKRIETF